MPVVPHWRMIVECAEEPELVDGVYHTIYTGAYAPRTPCGIHRGTPAKVWHEEEDPDVSVLCETCVLHRLPEETPGPPAAKGE